MLVIVRALILRTGIINRSTAHFLADGGYRVPHASVDQLNEAEKMDRRGKAGGASVSGSSANRHYSEYISTVYIYIYIHLLCNMYTYVYVYIHVYRTMCKEYSCKEGHSRTSVSMI